MCVTGFDGAGSVAGRVDYLVSEDAVRVMGGGLAIVVGVSLRFITIHGSLVSCFAVNSSGFAGLFEVGIGGFGLEHVNAGVFS